LGKKHLQVSLRAGKAFGIDRLWASKVIGICAQSSFKTHGAINSFGGTRNIWGNLLMFVGELNEVREVLGDFVILEII